MGTWPEVRGVEECSGSGPLEPTERSHAGVEAPPPGLMEGSGTPPSLPLPIDDGWDTGGAPPRTEPPAAVWDTWGIPLPMAWLVGAAVPDKVIIPKPA